MRVNYFLSFVSIRFKTRSLYLRSSDHQMIIISGQVKLNDHDYNNNNNHHYHYYSNHLNFDLERK